MVASKQRSKQCLGNKQDIAWLHFDVGGESLADGADVDGDADLLAVFFASQHHPAGVRQFARAPRLGDSLDDSDAPTGDGHGPGLANLAEDEDLLGVPLLDEEADLRPLQVLAVVGAGDGRRQLIGREACRQDGPHQRQADGALLADLVGARQLGLAKHPHVDDVADAEDLDAIHVGGRQRRAVVEAAGGGAAQHRQQQHDQRTQHGTQ